MRGCPGFPLRFSLITLKVETPQAHPTWISLAEGRLLRQLRQDWKSQVATTREKELQVYPQTGKAQGAHLRLDIMLPACRLGEKGLSCPLAVSRPKTACPKAAFDCWSIWQVMLITKKAQSRKETKNTQEQDTRRETIAIWHEE